MKEVTCLITTKCELLVSPCDEALPPVSPDRAYVEFVTGEGINSYDNCVLTYSHFEETPAGVQVIYDYPMLYKMILPKDQHYIYYRMWIKTDKLLSTPESREDAFYYDTITNKLMLGDKEITNSMQLEYIADNPGKWGSTFGIADGVVVESVYSLCKISRCLENLQRKFIFDVYADQKVEKCEDNANDKFIRDFLFSSVFILRQLVSQQRYEEADRILEKLNACGVVCNKTNNINHKCGCR